MNAESPTPATRWFIAAAAVAVHLCIGSVYAWSVFVKPIQKAIPCWSDATLSAAFSLAIVVLGLSAAFGGGWTERRGPRKSIFLSALFFAGGIISAGLAIKLRSLPLLYITYGLIGGIGLGLGYISPVSTLLKWFPDRRGLATGMAVCGFGAGALVTAPIATRLIERIGVPATLWMLGCGYLLVILAASRILRFPPSGYAPAGWRSRTSGAAQPHGCELADALRSGRFWLLWIVFFINISAGIMLISKASPIAQKIAGLTPAQASLMVGLMGIFNGAGRIAWSTASDYIGRAATYILMLLLQIALFTAMPHLRSALLFQIALFLILTCYGGGFATCPAFVADMFGARKAGAIYGVILTAWSAAGIFGPTLLSAIYQRTGQYTLAFRCVTAMLVAALGFALTIASIQARRSVAAAQASPLAAGR